MNRRLILLSCLVILTISLAACTNTATSSSGSTNTLSPGTASTQPTPLPAIMATGQFREFALPQPNSGMMRPAIDHEGRIWFGEMGHNYLAVFNPHIATFQQYIPPHGRNGIMGILVGPDDTIWFAEQYANYIGHFFPTSGTYHIYSLPTLSVPDPSDASKTLTLPSAPNDLAQDKQGNLWFTELNADAIGKLDPHTGLVQQYPLSPSKSVQKLNPYGITVDPQGTIWFTESSTGRVGRLDPSTGKLQFFTPSGSSYSLMEIASDPQGMLWITSFTSGLLLRLNPQSGTFTPYFAPYTGSEAGGIYGLMIASNGEIWLTISAENTIARFDTTTHQFIYYAIPTKGSLPLGLVMGSNHTLWFTEAGSDKIGMLQP